MNWHNNYWNQYSGFYKIKIGMSCDWTVTILVDTYAKGSKSTHHREIFRSGFIATLFIIVTIYKCLQCLWAEEYRNCSEIHTEIYSAIKKGERMRLQENGWNWITFRGRSQIQKTNMLVLVCRICVFNIKYNNNCHTYIYIYN